MRNVWCDGLCQSFTRVPRSAGPRDYARLKLSKLRGRVAVQVPVEDSVRSMVTLLTAATPERLNGRFVNWKGDDMPW